MILGFDLSIFGFQLSNFKIYMKLISWNVNGERAVTKKNYLEYFKNMDADVLCLQETKAQDDQVQEALASLEGYFIYSNSAAKKGYSGTAIITKKKPISVTPDIGISEHDTEGRVLCAEYDDFYLIDVYVPNSGSALKRLPYRQSWDIAFCDYLKKLEETKPLIVCGDFNVCHKPIDLARPKANYKKSAGFMQEEVDGMDRFTGRGLVDTFRHFYPDTPEKYSWWSYRAGARPRNIGWRLDYFLVSESYLSQVSDAAILADVLGSDHCPVSIDLK